MKKLIIVATCFISFSLLAADGSSGCGPGWYLLKKNSLVSSVLRVTTNALLFPIVTLGMTFGTSNCTKHSIVQTEQQSLYFVTQNYFELQKEMAKGYGPHITALGTTIGCKANEKEYFANKLQQKYNTIFESREIRPESALKEVYKIILQDERLVKSCSLS